MLPQFHLLTVYSSTIEIPNHCLNILYIVIKTEEETNLDYAVRLTLFVLSPSLQPQ